MTPVLYIPITVLLWSAMLAIDLYTDLRAKKVNHFRGGLLRLPVFVAIWLMSGWEWTFVLASAYWLAFDMGFALGRHQHPMWLGTTGILDKLQAPLPYWLRAMIKAGLIVVAVWVYV